MPAPIFRLYYDDAGLPLFYSTEDLPGNYVDIDGATFVSAKTNVRVKNGRIVEINSVQLRKIVPSTDGTACDSRDVCIVVADNHGSQTKWKLKNSYESN